MIKMITLLKKINKEVKSLDFVNSKKEDRANLVALIGQYSEYVSSNGKEGLFRELNKPLLVILEYCNKDVISIKDKAAMDSRLGAHFSSLYSIVGDNPLAMVYLKKFLN